MVPPRNANDSAPTPSRAATTTLPSIRHLLPDAGPSQPTYSLSRPHAHASPSTRSQHLTSMQAAYPPEPSNDSEEGDGERSSDSPPKKRRRRQALSCTECKRRKIKCDRDQPCGPCSRRGEQDKCQWHVLEPVEKYVTRTEYDHLLARFESLESSVHQWKAQCTANRARDAQRESSHAPTFRNRAQSISDSIASSSGDVRRAYKLESPLNYTIALRSPRTALRATHMPSPYDEQREPPVFHRVSHERSPSGGSHKGILKILQADAELANGRLSPDERRSQSQSRSISPIADGRSPSPLSVISQSSGERNHFVTYRPVRHEPYPHHYIRSTFCRDEPCDLDCGPYCVPTFRTISSSYHT